MRLSPFKLERYFARYEFDVKHLLCCSDCESLSVGGVLALEPGAEEGLSEQWLGYTESRGSPSLRREISRIYTGISAEEILVHSGAEEAIFLFMQALLEPGDHVIVHWPCYQSLAEVASGIGCRVTRWAAREDRGWALDLDDLVGRLRPETKAVVVNLPHNPTGYLMGREQFLEMTDILRARGIVLFSDEVYRESEYHPEDRLPAACDVYEKAVSLGVMSKSYGLAGLRIGWIATRATTILHRMAALKDYTTICSSAPSEFLAEVALRHRERLARRSVEIITANLRLLDAFFEQHEDVFAWQRPVAGPIGFPRLLTGDSEAFCDRLVRKAGVLLLPGTVFDDDGNHVRIGFGREDMNIGLARLVSFLESASG